MNGNSAKRGFVIESGDDEILVAFAEALDRDGTAAVVREWIGRYPAQARAIARFAAERIQPISSSAFGDASAISVGRVRQIGLEVARARRAAMAPAKAAISPLKSLLDAAKQKGLDPAGAASALDVPFGVFVKLHRRLISPDSVPASLVRKLADTIGRNIDEVSAYLRQPPTLAAGASYRSDDTPTVGIQESFADALRSDPEATGAQQDRWLNE